MLSTIEYKEQIQQFCDYSPIVKQTTEIFIEKHEKQLKHKINNNDYVLFACLFWFISKIIEDELISIDDYLRVTGLNKHMLTKHEKIIFKHYINNNNDFQKNLNNMIFKYNSQNNDNNTKQNEVNHNNEPNYGPQTNHNTIKST